MKKHDPELEATRAEEHLLRRALQCVMHETPHAKARCAPYSASLYRPESACEGVVILSFAPRGQTPQTFAYDMERARLELARAQRAGQGANNKDLDALAEVLARVVYAQNRFNADALAKANEERR